jgi:hypothetical protein
LPNQRKGKIKLNKNTDSGSREQEIQHIYYRSLKEKEKERWAGKVLRK